MRINRRGSWIAGGLLMAVIVLAQFQVAQANTSRSPSYEISEAEFGAGATLETCSGSYCAEATIGSLSGRGSSVGGAFAAEFSPINSESEPSIEVIIEPGNANLGVLSLEEPAFRTMLVHVRSHLAGGYRLQLIGDPPRFENHTLAAPSEATESLPGTEQFAINAVANTVPLVGKDPTLSTTEEVAEGVIMPNYATANLFAYSSGDVIAQTIAESSQIRYTISMIINVAGSTPAGHYAGDFSAVITPVF